MVVPRNSAVSERKLRWTNQIQTDQLLAGQIHLWLIPIDSLPTVYTEGFSDGLTERERMRAQRIIDKEKRKRYCGGRLGLRQLLEGYSGVPADKLEFTYGERGKPLLRQIVDGKQLEFNYTVSSGYALYAFAWNSEVGVDLEIYPREINHELFAGRILSNTEEAHWRKACKFNPNDTMLCCWTRKEAYGKLVGVGIRYRMNEVDVLASDRDCWQTNVVGLFEDNVTEKRTSDSVAEGVQIELPIPGAASLMYYQTGNFHPELLGFVYRRN